MKTITLATLSEATAQEVFDFVVYHLRIQNKKSINSNGSMCMYLSPAGLKCAAGCLIDELEYRSDFETKAWSNLVCSRIAPPTHENLIMSLQRIHDGHEVNTWEDNFKGLAARFDLEYTQSV